MSDSPRNTHEPLKSAGSLVALPTGSVTLRDRRNQTACLVQLEPHLLSSVPVTLRDRRNQTACLVQLEPHLLSSVPVTQAEYRDVLGDTPSMSSGDLFRSRPSRGSTRSAAAMRCRLESRSRWLTRWTGDEVLAVEGADGYRLPTEAEWEHACGGWLHGSTLWRT